MNEIIRWLPLIVAILTGIFALSQVRSNNITNARIKWLENLKQVLTDFISECAIYQIKEGVSKGIEQSCQNTNVNENIKDFSHFNFLITENAEKVMAINSNFAKFKLEKNYPQIQN